MLTRVQKQQWIDALRNNELPDGTKIKQGQAYLHRTHDNSMCCLGVACAIFKDTVGLTVVEESGHYNYDGITASLPPSMKTLIGISGLGEFGKQSPALEGAAQIQDKYNFLESLAVANDSGFTFSYIANYLELNLKTSD